MTGAARAVRVERNNNMCGSDNDNNNNSNSNNNSCSNHNHHHNHICSQRRRCSRFGFSCCPMQSSQMVAFLLSSLLAVLILMPSTLCASNILETTTHSAVVDIVQVTTVTTSALEIQPHLSISDNDRNQNDAAEGKTQFQLSLESKDSKTDAQNISSLSNQEDDNEIQAVWKAPSSPKYEFLDDISLTEDLEETIRNAVKNEIENEQNGGTSSIAILNALKNIPEPEVRQKLTEEILSRNHLAEGREVLSLISVTESNESHPTLRLNVTNNRLNHSLSSADTVNVANTEDLFQPITEVEEVSTIDPTIQLESDNFSIVFDEPLTATEPPALISASVQDDPNLDEILKESQDYEATTLMDLHLHSVIKKQGVDLGEVNREAIREILGYTELSLAPIKEDQSVEIIEAPLDVHLNVSGNDKDFDLKELTTELTKVHLEVTTNVVTVETEEPLADTTELWASSTENSDYPDYNDSNENSTEEPTYSSKGLRSLNVQTLNDEAATLSKSYTPHNSGQTFDKHIASESFGEIGKVIDADGEVANRSMLIIVACASTAFLFVVISVTMFLVSFQRQHGTLDIEMQERRCGKDDEDLDTCQKLLEIELPPPVIDTIAEETDECI